MCYTDRCCQSAEDRISSNMSQDRLQSSPESHDSPGSSSSHEGSGNSVATSPSSLGVSTSPSGAYDGDNALSKETQGFLADLDNYLALGCLCFEDLLAFEEHHDSSSWQPVSQLPQILAFNETLYADLQRLNAAGWIRLFSKRGGDSRFLIFRIYILPFDIGNRHVDRQSKRLYFALESLVAEVDISTETWQGNYIPGNSRRFDVFATRDDGSLFWMFNKLPSPSPSIGLVKEKYAREALEDLLDPTSCLPGLKTELYPYQRRSAGLMLQRETVATLELDPRLEQRTTPDGSVFYFGPRDLVFLRQPRYYEACKGGILAETMGLGKTVICLATILATKDHPPVVPAVCSLPPVRPFVASLADMAVSTINRKSIPWRVELARIKHATGDELQSCREKLEKTPAYYEIPVMPMRWNRKTIQPPPKKMILAATTLIVVPRNLCKQWQSEIRKHVDADLLRILVMEDSKKELPPADDLRTYDIVLFTRGRFEMEIKDGADDQGRRIGATQLLCRCPYIGATRIRDCHCLRTDDLYDSPLKHLHFKRLIIDEGHFFSNTNAAAVTVANKLITADHRWVVSGTPAKDLLGVEVDMSAAENLWHTPDTKKSRDTVLEQRRHFSKRDDTVGAIKSLGGLATHFLKIKPWSAPDISERRADWEEYIYRHEDLRKRTFSGFSLCLRRTLKGMVVKTQPEDVEKDINLPPLSHEVVRLEPSFYDKLTANLFTLVLTANAITSERTDMDYLFHKNSQKARSQLISNLRTSAFFWTGFSETDVLASLKSSNGYLAKEGTNSGPADRRLLTETLACANTVLESQGWKTLSKSHELGLFIDNWPSENAEHWTFDGSCQPLLTGVSQLLEAQKHVNERVDHENPGEGLSGVGIRALAPAKYGTVKKEDGKNDKSENKPILTKGIPTSSLDGEPLLRRRASLTNRGEKSSPKKSSKPYKVVKSQKQRTAKKLSVKAENTTGLNDLFSDGQAAPSQPEPVEDYLPADSPYVKSRIVGTTSAKLSYLISQILKYYQQEKILVFYDSDNVAYYIAQMLEVLHIKHEIYAKSLPAYLKSEYVVRFDQESQDRVLLMDVRNAAFGLNLPSASRIFFVNPVCRPNIEAQAIKRAHRIGQTQKVFVETLVLKGTIEEKMLERSKRMTRSEHHDAKALEDDGGIREIIQSAKVLPVLEHEKTGHGQMALLEEPQQLWSRPGWRAFTKVRVARPDAESKKRKAPTEESDESPAVRADSSSVKAVRRKLDFVDCTDSAAAQQNNGEDSDDEPISRRWRRDSLDSPLAHRARPEAGKDPFLPLTPPGSEFATYPVKAELPSPDFEPLIIDEGADVTPYRKVSIAHLLNSEPSSEQKDVAAANLVLEILRRL